MKHSGGSVSLMKSFSFSFLLEGYHVFSELSNTLICEVNFGLCLLAGPGLWVT